MGTLRGAVGLLLLASVGCTPSRTASVVKLQGVGAPGRVGFGIVSSVTQTATTLSSVTGVGIAAGVEPDAPLGDYVWHLRERLLEYCAWQSGEPTDCRLAVFEGAASQNPTFVEPVNLGRFRSVLRTDGQRSALVASAVGGRPGSLPYAKSRGVWVRGISPLPFLPAPLHYCGLEDRAPTCRLVVAGAGKQLGRVLALGVERADGVDTEYLWATVGALGSLVPFVGLSFDETGVVRCKITTGKTPPECVDAKWE